jgi:hypothetical protein
MNVAQSYYSLLEVTPDSTLEEIHKAYRIKAKKFHPDVNSSPHASDQFICIHNAFEKIMQDKMHKSGGPTPESAPWSNWHDPYFYRNHGGYTRKYARQKKQKFEFTTTKQGRSIYIGIHLIFAVTGFLIFVNPVVMTFTNSFDPDRPLLDSLFAAFIVMIIGIIMTVKISLSLISFLRNPQ